MKEVPKSCQQENEGENKNPIKLVYFVLRASMT